MPGNPKVKWGVLGSGGLARCRTIPEGILPSVNGQLAAVFDVSAQVNTEFAKQCGAKAAGSIEELPGCDLDAVYVATPPNVHCERPLACARAGKHVFCDLKP
jgi:predicted dehydrogenase